MIDFRAFSQEIKSSDCDVLLDSPMSAQTTFKAGGNAKAIAFPKTRDALKNSVYRILPQGTEAIF